MKRVCILCESWKSGGIEAFLYNVISHMDRSELEIDLVAAQLGKSIFTQPLKKLGIRFYQLSGSTQKVLENHRILRELLAERQYDVLHLNAYQGLSLAYLKLAQKMGVSMCIAHSHNTALRASLTKPLKLAVHNWAKMQYTKEATDLWTCAKPAAEFLFSKIELNKKGYTFIPNGIDTNRFQFDSEMRKAVRTKLQLEKKFVIGNVGRLCYQKNQMFLLDVLAKLLNRKPESVLLLVGEGEDKTALQMKAQKLGVSDNVIFYGVTNQIERLLWSMDVFAFPSLFEGFGIAAIEAQAAGLPTIASEFIPVEANLLEELFYAAPLQNGPDEWADVILAFSKITFPRERAANAVKEHGFDIVKTSDFIVEKYRGK